MLICHYIFVTLTFLFKIIFETDSNFINLQGIKIKIESFFSEYLF